MATKYDAAVEALYRGPLDAFVAERKRLAAELKAGGDKEAAARLLKLGRPSISAWAVNQLWWLERATIERLLATAARLRKGELDAGVEHQRALAALRSLAAERLTSAGHAAPESTLRRVTATLSALAVSGEFDPDPAGALAADRDPPGFGALGIDVATLERAPTRVQADEERKRADAERQRIEEERARRRAERQRIESALRAARNDAARQERDVERVRSELGDAEQKLEKAKSTIAELEKALAGYE
jgi:DNA repair exonuclease SbcCD ATPase subunit